MARDTQARIAEIAGAAVTRMAPLGGGCVGDVSRVELTDGRMLVAKTGAAGSGLAVEGYMLGKLAELSDLPVPQVLHADDSLLLMTHIESGGGIDNAAQVHAADLVSALHSVRGPAFGFECDTVIATLPQPNPESPRWLDFFRDQRLLFMGAEAHAAGRLPPRLLARIETLAGRLSTWIEEPDHPSLLHGDMWTGNVLCRKGRVVGFIDPAIYFGDAEIELAFSTLFGTFGKPFFDRYRERRPLRPGFFEARRDLYNLYPLLVHVRLFGGSYVGSVDGILSKFGC